MLRSHGAGDRSPRRVAALPLGAARRRARGHAPPTWSAAPCATLLARRRRPAPTLDVAVDGELEAVLAASTLGEIEVAKRHERFGTATVRARAGADRPGPDPARDLRRRPGRCRTSSPAGHRARTSPAATSPSTPWRIAAGRAARAARPVRRARADLEPGIAAGPPRRAPSSTTRPGRSARRATRARLGLTPEPSTLALLAMADLGTVSADRRDAELRRLAAEPTAGGRLRAARRMGAAASAARQRSGADRRPSTERSSRRAVDAASPSARRPRILLAVGAGRRRSTRPRRLAPARPAAPVRGGRARRRARPGRAARSPRGRAAAGSTVRERVERDVGSRSAART